MKAFTDLEQSKKLAKVLPLESADMWFAERYAGHVNDNGEYIVAEKPVYYLSLGKPSDTNYTQDVIRDIPCWSLAALLDIIPWGQVNRMNNSSKWEALSWKDSNFVAKYHVEGFDTPIDACYELILKLHEHKLLSNK